LLEITSPTLQHWIHIHYIKYKPAIVPFPKPATLD